MDTSYYTYYAQAGLPDTWLRSYPQFTTMYRGTNDGRSYYNSLQLSLRRQAGAVKFGVNYTFSKSIDNWALEGNGTTQGSVMDYRNSRLNRGLSNFDHTHSLNSNWIYSLPVGKNRRFLGDASRIVDTLLGGWDLGVLNTWQSGSPMTVVTGRSTGPNSAGSYWANYSGPRDIGSIRREGNGVYFFTPEQRDLSAGAAQFTFANAGEFGTAGRNTFRGPRFFNFDASLTKSFKITETHAIKFRAEAYNALNNVNFANPSVSIATASSFGKISSTVGPNGSGGARIMQMALRYDF